jgi:hypothetical protein
MPNPLLSVVIPLHNAAGNWGVELTRGQTLAFFNAYADYVLALKRWLDRRLQRT